MIPSAKCGMLLVWEKHEGAFRKVAIKALSKNMLNTKATRLGGKYRLGSHWQTIQRSLFPEWESEMDMKFIEEEKRRRAEADAARKTGTVNR